MKNKKEKLLKTFDLKPQKLVEMCFLALSQFYQIF